MNKSDNKKIYNELLKDKAKLEKHVKEVHSKFDFDKNGYIEITELKFAMEALCKDIGCYGSSISNDDVKNAMKMLDRNSDQRLNVEEFTIYVKQILKIKVNS